MRPDATYRDLPGHALWNPLGCGDPAWVLNIVAVTEPDTDGMVRLSAVEGEVVCWHGMDWWGLWRTPETTRNRSC